MKYGVPTRVPKKNYKEIQKISVTKIFLRHIKQNMSITVYKP